MEFVDEVDIHNVVIGSCSKEKAHKKGILHRTVIAEIINSKGEFLLVKQAGHKQDANQYVSPVGGHVSSGETEEHALLREAFEETGLKDFTYQLKGRIIYHRKVIGRNENHYFIVYEIHSNQKPNLNDESVQYHYFSKTEIQTTMKLNPKKFGDAFYVVWKEFYSDYFA